MDNVTLPKLVEKCLRDKKYRIVLQEQPVERMIIHEEYKPKEETKKLCIVDYLGNGRVAFSNPSNLDPFLVSYITQKAAQIGEAYSYNNAKDFCTAFKQLQAASGRFWIWQHF